MATKRDMQLARVAKKHGAQYCLRIVWECRRSDVPVSAGFALIEKESGFRNVFGHDPTGSIPDEWKGKAVTRERYRHYKMNRGRLGMQGVGPAQLTWWEYQDRADALGGCWMTAANIRVGIGVLGAHYKAADGELREAFRRYNGSGRAAIAYASDAMARQRKWHGIFDREAE